MKKTTFLLIIMLAVCNGIMAQNQERRNRRQGERPEMQMHKDKGPRPPRINEEEFRQRVQELITQEAELSKKEADAFFPIFHEYKGKQRDIHKSIDKIRNSASDDDSEETCQERIMQIAELNAGFAKLDNQYYPKLIKAVSAKKFFRILCTEDRVARRILHNYNQKQNKRSTRNTPQDNTRR